MNPVFRIEGKRLHDDRGWFSETYSEGALAGLGVSHRFVQDNQSFSARAGTVRGIHFQTPPKAQAKLVRCIRGSVMDYAVDLRRGSPTYGHFVGTILSSAAGDQLYIPVGFGHAFVTLEADVEVAYKVSDAYDALSDRGLAWNDPLIGIDWPLPASGAILSAKDRALPMLATFESPFAYDGRPLTPLPDPA